MLLGPQISEQLRHPAVDRAEPMQARVAGAAEGDQRGGPVRGPAVVNDERRRRKANATGAVVALEDPFPLAGEAGAVTPPAVVAGLAEPVAVEIRRSAGAAQGKLLVFEVGGHR